MEARSNHSVRSSCNCSKYIQRAFGKIHLQPRNATFGANFSPHEVTPSKSSSAALLLSRFCPRGDDGVCVFMFREDDVRGVI